MHKFLFFISLLISNFNLFAQKSEYDTAWGYLNEGNFKESISSFEKASNSASDKEKSLFMLCYLHASIQENEISHKYFKKLIKESAKPAKFLIPLWEQLSVYGTSKKISDFHKSSVDEISANSDIIDKLPGFLADAKKYSSILENNNSDFHKNFNLLSNWQLLGALDNHMNAGFNKYNQVLEGPESNKKFKSKYGAEVSWYKVNNALISGYLYKDQFFSTPNSIMFSQCFVESDSDQEVFLNFGYAGNLKIWLNDQELYSNEDYRQVSFDYFSSKVKLKKGWNRVLVQLGLYNGETQAVGLYFSELKKKPVYLNQSNDFKEYTKESKPFSTQENITLLEAQELQAQNPNDPFYNFLIAKHHLANHNFETAEKLILDLLKLQPKNYAFIREMIVIQQKMGNETLRSKYFENYRSLFPEDFDVLVTNLNEGVNKKDKEGVNSAFKKIEKLYPNNQFALDILRPIGPSLDEKYDEVLSQYNEMSKKYYYKKEFLDIYLNIMQNTKTPSKTIIEYLEKSLKKRFDFAVNNSLVNEYLNAGNVKNALKLINESKNKFDFYSSDLDKVRIFQTKLMTDSAIAVLEKLVFLRPTDHNIYSDLGKLYYNIGNTEKALSNKAKALIYNPYSLETNEEIMEIKKQDLPYDFSKKFEPSAIIKEYETKATFTDRKEIDYVLDKKQRVLYKSGAKGERVTNIIKIKEESALTNWQETTIYSVDFSDTKVFDVKTIKKNGAKIDADGNEGRYVFKNLEVGDYIFVDYVSKQNDGDKTADFFEDIYYFNSYFPCFRSEYGLFYEDGVRVVDSVFNGKVNVELKNKNSFTSKIYSENNVGIIKSENNSSKLNELAKILRVTNTSTWKDVSDWYYDLTNIQAKPKLIVTNTFNEIFKEKTDSEEEKAKKIYEYICNNISYSSVDFRQSGLIPQTASQVLDTKMGDCKDISTLFVSLARMAGLNANLVLVSTSDRGRQYIHYPSISFNHCIVKLNLKNGPKYLELTNNKLPYGYLNNTHFDASILDINNHNLDNTSIKFLRYNSSFLNAIKRSTSVEVQPNNKIKINRHENKVGNEAAITYEKFLSLSDDDKKDKLKEEIANAFKSKISLVESDFSMLRNRNDSAKIKYSFTADNEIVKVGTFKSLKIPFSDLLAQNSLFDEENRVHPIDFNTYEPVDIYEERLTVSLSGEQKFTETPENINLEWNGFKYSLSFKFENKQKLNISRNYTAQRNLILPKEYEEAKKFFQKIIEAENTNLVFK